MAQIRYWVYTIVQWQVEHIFVPIAVHALHKELRLHAVRYHVLLLRTSGIHVLPFAFLVQAVQVHTFDAGHGHVLHVEVVYQVPLRGYALRVGCKSYSHTCTVAV